MPTVTPTLNLPQPATPPAPPKPALPPVAAPAPAIAPPSTTVTLSPQAMNAMATSHPSPPSPSPSTASSTSTAPAPHDSSIYDSLKSGIANVVADVGDAIAGGAHAIVEGVETTLSTANTVATGIVELPFAAVAKACDAAGAVIDEF